MCVCVSMVFSMLADSEGNVCMAQDMVFVIPPPQFPFQSEDDMRHGVDMSQVWHCRVLLLFRIMVQLDSDMAPGVNSATQYELAFMEVLSMVTPPLFRNPHHRKMLYAPKPQMRVYVIPVKHILGRLAVVPAGDTGTISNDYPAAWFGSDAKRDPAGTRGKGSELWYINEWAMRWATDYVRRHNQESEDDTDPDSMDDAHSSESSEGGGSMHSANDRHNEWAMGWAAVAAADSDGVETSDSE